MSEPDRVLVEILVAAPIDIVWHALRDPAEIRRWFGWEYAGLTEEIQMIFAGETKGSDADHTLRFAGVPDRYTLEAHGSGQTIVRLIRSAPVTDPGWTGIYDDIIEGWMTFTQHLRFTLERHRGADRRTLFLNGRAKTAGTPLPAEALGLTGLQTVGVGGRYSTTMATATTRTATATPATTRIATAGATLEGTVWFRSAHQVGVTVDGYGDGLLIVNTRPTTARSAHGGGTVLISAYGLDDQTFAGLRERWATWWGGRYELIEIQPAE